jgi:acetyl esterase/lipase
MSDKSRPVAATVGLAGVTFFPGIEYAQVLGFRPLELDLYLPAAGQPAGQPAGEGEAPGPDAATVPIPVPVVVHVHGGGWRRGSRRHPLPALGDGFYAGLAAQGIAVAAIDYRLSGEARYPAAVDDVRAAVAWARAALCGDGLAGSGPAGSGSGSGAVGRGPVGAVAGAAGGGPPGGPVVVWGDSAGGHLALLAALTGTEVDGVVAWFPVTDLTSLNGADPQSREALFLGAPPAQVPGLAREASPITHVHPGAPPVLLMHGDSDAMVPSEQSIRFAKALNDAGGRATLELVPGASHFWDGAADVPGIVARSAAFVRSLTPQES